MTHPQRIQVQFKPHKEPAHEEKSNMINSVMKNQEPQINADERRSVVPETNTCHRSSFQFVLVRCFLSVSFMNQGFKIDIAVINSANRSKPPLELKPFDYFLKRCEVKS